MEADEAEDIAAFETAATRLHALSFPALVRPTRRESDFPRVEEVMWAVDVYAFSLLAHGRQLIESFVLLARHGHTPTTFFVARALYELAGHAMHVSNGLRRALPAGDHKAAWELLQAASMGSRDLSERCVPTADGAEWPKPVNVMAAARAVLLVPDLSKGKNEKQSEELYAFLCEFCHPNVGAFSQYRRFEERDGRTTLTLRSSPSSRLPIHEAAIAVGMILHAATELFALYDKHPELAGKVLRARDEFIDTRQRTRRNRRS